MPPSKKNANRQTVKKAKRKAAKKKTAKRKTAKKAINKEPEVEPTVVVLFFAHWCGHCQSMYPEWEQLKKEYAAKNNYVFREVEHGKIENDKPNLEKEYDLSPIQVQGFPTLVKFHPHKEIEYYESGERTKDNFMNWLNADAKQPDAPSNIFHNMYGGYKIPHTGKVKTYSKNKSLKKQK